MFFSLNKKNKRKSRCAHAQRHAPLLLQITAKFLAGVLLISILGPITPALAFAGDILIFRSNDSEPYQLFEEGFSKAINHKIVVETVDNDNTDIQKLIDKHSPDAVLALGPQAAWYSRNTETTPVYYSMLSNPGRYKLNEFSGVELNSSPREYMEQIADILPIARTVGVIYSKNNADYINRAIRVARSYNIRLIAKEINKTEDLNDAVDSLLSQVDVMWLISDPIVTQSARLIKELIILKSLRKRIPVVGLNKWSVKNGTLFCLSADYERLGIQTARLVSRKLRGEKGISQEYALDADIYVNGNVVNRLINYTTIRIPTHSYLLK